MGVDPDLVEKQIMLQVLDQRWKEHLANMDYLRQGIHLRAYAQKQPKQEYKRESFELFSALLDNIKLDYVRLITRLKIAPREDLEARELERRKAASASLKYSHASSAEARERTPARRAATPRRERSNIANFTRSDRKIGRNEPCPCGSRSQVQALPRRNRPLRAASVMTAISGVRLGTGRGGISSASVYEGREDVLVMEFDAGTSVAGVFTQNSFRASRSFGPGASCRKSVRAFLVNTGNANAATGDEGFRRAAACCRMVAERLGIDETSVLPFSTGVIGEQLPLEALRIGIAKATEALSEEAWQEAAKAIMTTDTRPKRSLREVSLGAGQVRIEGIAKGAGMIAPNMATMLAFIATDAKWSRGCWGSASPTSRMRLLTA